MPGESRSKRAVRSGLLLVLAVAAAVVLRVELLQRDGIWADEVFSLAIATGHSLEHPSKEADPTKGDFVEPEGVVPAGDFHTYLRHDEPPASLARVARAVMLSDTSPPLYYLLLSVWSRLFGTSDDALRAFSLVWAIASLPMIWLVGRQVAGPTAGALAVILFCFSPIGVFYATEGRMYSMLWFLALLLVWTTLLLGSRQTAGSLTLLWGLAAGAGLLTHYFFAFVWAACSAWLWLHPKRRRIAVAAAATGLSLLTAAGWYWRLPESLGRWRVTGYWLNQPLTAQEAWSAPFKLAWSFVSGGVHWKSWAPISSPFRWDPYVAVVLIGLAAAIALTYLSGRQPRGWSLFASDAALVWTWLGATLLGPLAFDLWRGTYTSLIPRYSQAGLPAALVLLAAAFALLAVPWRQILLLGLLCAWVPANLGLLSGTWRSGEPYRELGGALSRWARPSRVILVQSTPSGLLGITRYMAPNTPLASWIEQLGQREVAEDLERLLEGREEIAVVEVHTVRAPARPRDWLRAHARDTGTWSGVHTFGPACGAVFGESCMP